MAKKVVMVVMDGWGVGAKDSTNPIHLVNPKNIDYIKHHFPSGVIQASGIAVGLPWNEEGNSEVGHLTLGSGRVIYQHYPRITLSIRGGQFFENQILLEAINKAKEKQKDVHIIGVLSGGNVHAAMDHIVALGELAKRQGLERIIFHCFTDGKDSGPKDSSKLFKKLFADTARDTSGEPIIKIGSIMGRYYGMDRDSHWDRTQRAYDAITGKLSNELVTDPAIQYIESQYEKGETDEYITPITLNAESAVKPGDSVIFFNFREDSIRQLVEKFIASTSPNGINSNSAIREEATKDITLLPDTHIVTFTNYKDGYNVPVAFPPEEIKNPLGAVISANGKRQLRIAETNKYAHVTYFFNGFVEEPFKEEYRVLVPSQSVARYDLQPEMRASEIATRTVEALNEGIYDFILINFANADIVAHTGNMEATKKAVEIVDEQIGKLMNAVLKMDAALVITADHGNAEKVMYAETGLPETSHDKSPVPIYVVMKELYKDKDDQDVAMAEKQSAGLLSDVAPTVLAIMGIPQPPEMTGISLLNILE